MRSSPAACAPPQNVRPLVCVAVASFDPVAGKLGEPVAETETKDGRPWLMRSVLTMLESKFVSDPLFASTSMGVAAAPVVTIDVHANGRSTTPTPARVRTLFNISAPGPPGHPPTHPELRLLSAACSLVDPSQPSQEKPST